VGIQFQPSVTRGDATVRLVDLALLGVVAAALASLREDVHRLDGSRWLWITAAAFLAFVVAASIYPLAFDDRYDWTEHLVTAVRYGVYALLAPAVALLARDPRSLQRLWATVAVWGLAAAAVAIVQFAGLDVFDAWPAWIRQPSFAGIPELGTLGGAAIAVGLLGLLSAGSMPEWVWVGGLVGGTLDVVLSSGVAAQIGVVAAAVAALVLVSRRVELDRRRVAAAVGVAVVCGLGVLALRVADFEQYARSIGLSTPDRETTDAVQTYAHRQLIYYIGYRVWLDHPVLGAGWQSFREEQVYSPFLDDARRRFPDQPALAFPSPEHPYGIDNAYIQVAAELGLVGLALLAALLAVALVLGVRRSVRAPPVRAQVALIGVLWLLVVMGTWVGQGLGAGSAFAALSWLAVGLVAAAGSPADG
jgi:O-antigen ligase